MTSYLAGTGVTMRADEYRNAAGQLVDPDDVVLTYRRPSGVETVVPKSGLANPTVGTWLLEFVADEPGDWAYTFEATNPTVVAEGSFTIEPVATSGGMLQPGAGPCTPWATEDDLLDGWTPPTSGTPALYVRCLDASSDILFARSGRRWPGVCTDRVRPHGACGGPAIVLPFGGTMAEFGGVGSFDSPSFATHHSHPANADDPFELSLGSYPIRSVQEVRVDGVVLDPSRWRVMDWSRLRRIDGVTWPCCNFVVGDVARVEVDFTFGEAPPSSGVIACVALARELTKAIAREACALDRRVQQITREGVTITIPGLVDSLKEGKTGIPEVDLFLWSHNPNGLARRGRIIIPGRDQSPRRRTFP